MTTEFTNPSEDEIRHLLESTRRIVVVGLSPKPERPSHQVAAALQRFGYQIVPVHPRASEILGEKVYAELAAVPGPIDLVDVFRAPDQVDAVVDACIALRIPAVWLQLGVVNRPAAERARAAGIQVVMDRCVFRDYVRLFGAVPRSAS